MSFYTRILITVVLEGRNRYSFSKLHPTKIIEDSSLFVMSTASKLLMETSACVEINVN
jgi:hypothetical protein